MRDWAFLVATSVAAALASPPATAPGGGDILIADFEGPTYGDWKVEGEAFGKGPARGTLPRQMPVSGFRGKGLVNTFLNGDGTTGTLTSPPCKVQRRYICFLIGGGGYAGQTCMDLLVDGKVVRTAAGPNVLPGGSEALDWHCWDVADLAGREAVIRIVDARMGGWGHINVDHIIQSDRPRKSEPADRTLSVDKRYLHLPVKTGAAKTRMRFLVDGAVAREFDIELAEGDPDLWVFADVSAFRGKELRIQADRLAEGSKALEAIVPSDELPDAANLYKEKLRPQFHFSSRRGWNNDCNGLVYHKGQWHLYYQHNPYGWSWGNMHWGHAVSGDLVHWTELPVAIYPHRHGDWVFSGSAVVDEGNTAGFKAGDEDVIVAAYTSTGRGECIAYSRDRGRTFTDYEGNPVVKHSGRDPKVIWYAPGKHWVMAVYDEREGSRGIAFYSSPDLKAWTFTSRIDRYYECPELFEIPVEGGAGQTRWIVYAADGQYAVGRFDGKTFTAESGKHRFSYGNCFYASQTWNNIPPADGRRIQIAWGKIATPGMPFNQCMLFPVELTLRTTDEGPRLFAVPVREIAKLHARKHALRDVTIQPEKNPLAGVTGELFDIRAEFEPGGAEEVGLVVRGLAVAYDAKKQELTCKGCKAPMKPIDGKVRLQVLVDRTSIEVFGNDGHVYMPVGAIAPEEDKSLAVTAKGDGAKLTRLEVHELRSAWAP